MLTGALLSVPSTPNTSHFYLGWTPRCDRRTPYLIAPTDLVLRLLAGRTICLV